MSVLGLKQTVLWSSQGLPADAALLVPCPSKPAALLLCPSYILFVQQGSQVAVVVNSRGVAGVQQPRVEFDPLYEPPHVTATNAARRYALN
ncbi:uncharacterized protein HaLaN_08537, partial [Haematococcus lacustris]